MTFVVSTYTRSEAIADGVLIEVDPVTLANCGYRLPLVYTDTLQGHFEQLARSEIGMGDNSREAVAKLVHVKLIQLMTEAHRQISIAGIDPKRATSNRVAFKWEDIDVILHIGPGDDEKPVFTLMCPMDD